MTLADAPLPLDYKPQPNPPPRPRANDPAIRRQAVETIMPEIIAWFAEDWRERDREEIMAQIAAVVTEHDGYAACRVLERKGWDPNADLVEILDGLSTWQAEREAVAAWVAANLIQPTLAIGDRVTAPQIGEGEIILIDEEHATYGIRTPACRSNSDFLIPYEDCRSAS